MRLIFLALVITSAFNLASAQTAVISMPKSKAVNSNTMKKDPFSTSKSGYASEGFRVSVFKPSYDMSISVNAPNVNVDEPNMSGGNGLFLGYAYLPVKSFGFIAGANYIELISNGRSGNTLRLEASGVWAFNDAFYAKLGINNSRIVSAGAGSYDPGMGHQMGIGFQLTKNLGLDLTHSQSAVTYTENFGPGMTVDADFVIRGTEIGLTGTF